MLECWLTIQYSISVEKTALQLNIELGVDGGGSFWFYCQPKSKPLRLKTWDFGFEKPLGLKTWDFGFGLRLDNMFIKVRMNLLAIYI